MEGFVVNLRCCFDEVLEVGMEEEILEVDKFVVGFVFNVDYFLLVLVVVDLFVVDDDWFFGIDDGERN